MFVSIEKEYRICWEKTACLHSKSACIGQYIGETQHLWVKQLWGPRHLTDKQKTCCEAHFGPPKMVSFIVILIRSSLLMGSTLNCTNLYYNY